MLTDERLAAIKSSLDYCVNPTSVLGQWTPELIALVSEVIERRAADSPAPKAEPSLFDKDLVDLVCYYERYIMDNWTDTPDERSRMADATVNALTQLQGYRAAEREQAAPEPNVWPLGWALVQDGGMVRVVNSKGVAVAAYAIQIESAPVAPRNVQCHDVADFYKDEEPQEQAATEANTKPLGWVDRLLEDWEKGYENAADGSVSKTNAAWYINRLREAYSEQAAPELRKPAKWQRRLKRMGDTARVGPYTGNNGFVCSVGIGPDKRFYRGSTAKAAIAAAWRAWKEEQGDA